MDKLTIDNYSFDGANINILSLIAMQRLQFSPQLSIVHCQLFNCPLLNHRHPTVRIRLVAILNRTQFVIQFSHTGPGLPSLAIT